MSDNFDSFNEFIVDNVLIDLPLNGRKFTWYKGDGRSMSRLDRFLLSEEWCLMWPNGVRGNMLRKIVITCSLRSEAFAIVEVLAGYSWL